GAHVHGAAVDLVEGQPVFHLVLVALKQHLAVLHVQVHQLAAGPAVVFFDQGIGQLVVADGDQRLDAVLFAAVKDAVVEGQALFVGLGLLPGGEDAGPVDGGAEGLEPHLGKQGDVLLVVVVEVDGLVAGVAGAGLRVHGGAVGVGVAAVGAVVGDAVALAVHVPGALELVGGTGAAPQEIVTENAHMVTSSFS